MRTVHGTWIKYNLFIDENGEKIEIYPYKITGDKYEKKFPLKCFMLIDGDEVIEVLEEEEQDKTYA